MQVDELLSKLQRVKKAGDGWSASCPAHEDTKASLSISLKDDKILLHCFAGCSVEAVLQALKLEMKDLFTKVIPLTRALSSPNRCNRATLEITGCTLSEYWLQKRLQPTTTQQLSVTEVANYNNSGKPALKMPYFDRAGARKAVRSRISMEGDKFRWRADDKPILYGLWKLTGQEEALVLCEGESDYHTLFEHGISALALPGADNWKEERDARHFETVKRIYIIIEPDAGGEAVKKWLSSSRIKDKAFLVSLHPFKDPSALHCDSPEKFNERFQAALDAAEFFLTVEAREREKQASEAWEKCKELAKRGSILEEFKEILPSLSVAGEEKLCELIYLAMISRLFDRPVSVGVKGPSAGGKSFAVQQVCKLFPDSAFYALSSLSDNGLAYCAESFKHRMIVLYEAVGMESDHISYIIRTLLSEGRIRHQTVIKGPNGLEPLLLDKEGPTGLVITTTAISLHPENETRMLSICVNDSREQTKAVLKALAGEEPEAVNAESWKALQEWLEAGERRVSIPYAAKLAELIPPVAVRLRRDFSSVLSLIRAHALLHRASRTRDGKGRIVASLEDYGAVRELVSDYIAEALESTVGATVRETVEAVKALKEELEESINITKIAKHLQLDKSATSRRVQAALEAGYLVNKEQKEEKGKKRKVRKYDLEIGEPMPAEQAILPAPELLQEAAAEQEATEEAPVESQDEAPAPEPAPEIEQGSLGVGENSPTPAPEESDTIPPEGIPF